MRISTTTLVLFFMLFSCKQKKELPILSKTILSSETEEIVSNSIIEFELTNQLGQDFGSQKLANKVTVVDFFFTSCPTICPVMTSHLKMVQHAFAGNERLQILSFSIDAKNDTPMVLRKYAQNYSIDISNWQLLTGDQSKIFALAKDFKVRAFDDSMQNERNLIHDGTFVLIDQRKRIRGYYNGLEKKDTQRMIIDIKTLMD